MASDAHVTFDRARLLEDVRAGLLNGPRSLPPKYFYDRRGSELFDAITQLPEYYPTRTEYALLQRITPIILEKIRPHTLVELGAGNASKTRVLLAAMVQQTPGGACYIPIDVSGSFLESVARELRSEFPGLTVLPLTADFASHFALPSHPSPPLHIFLGSTIGNFTPTEAIDVLAGVRERMQPGASLLLGTDLRKDVSVLLRAYNDSRGITADFNRNVLRVVNTELGADFEPTKFEHSATYNRIENRIEMRLVSAESQTVHIPTIGDISFQLGDTILTELSYKYDRTAVADILAAARLRMTDWLTDPDSLFALALARPAD